MANAVEVRVCARVVTMRPVRVRRREVVPRTGQARTLALTGRMGRPRPPQFTVRLASGRSRLKAGTAISNRSPSSVIISNSPTIEPEGVPSGQPEA